MLRSRIILCTVILVLLAAAPAAAFHHWNGTRASALLPGDLVTVRTENGHGPGLVNSLLYAQNGVQEVILSLVPDGPSTLEATVPGPVATRRPYGFRLVAGEEIDVLAVRLAPGSIPGRTDLTRLAEDPVGDDAFGLPHLDLVDCRVSLDGTRLYAALTNAGGGFPVNSGLTFFSYLLGISNPASAGSDTVFGMIQTVAAAGIIEPGLYQINGDGVDDLVKLGEIDVVELPGENTIVLSCLLADLEANPVFQSWYDPTDPRLDVAGFTQRISLLSGVVEADRTPGGFWHLREVALDAGPNQLPQLSDLEVPAPGSGGFVSVAYYDPDGHCPVIAEVVFDGTDTYPLGPQTLDYGVPVEYRSEVDLPPLLSGSPVNAVVRFSDNLVDTVERENIVSGLSPIVAEPWVRASPNPFSATTSLSFELGRGQVVHLTIYDLAGRRVRTVVQAELPAGEHAPIWDGRDAAGRPVPSGVYFYRLQVGDREIVRRLTLVR